MNKCRCPFHNCQNEIEDAWANEILRKRDSLYQAGGEKPRDPLIDLSVRMGICVHCLRQYQQNHH